jgi:hypothetical protein
VVEWETGVDGAAWGLGDSGLVSMLVVAAGEPGERERMAWEMRWRA